VLDSVSPTVAVPETTGIVLFVGAVGVSVGVAQERTPEPLVINT
jgi:hypothetical protein